MDRWRKRTWMFVALATLALACLSSAQTTAKAPATAKPDHRHPHRKPALKPIVLPPLPPGPLPQLPMDQIPAAPPKVGFQNGLLTIVAQNSTLSEILSDVRKLTGASIEIPTNANERVVTRLGPGAPRDVLVSLLNGSSFNYVMVGSNSDPNGVTAVVLTAKPAGGAAGQTVANVYQPNQGYAVPPQPFVAQQVPPQAVGAQPAPAEDANADEQDGADPNADADQGQSDANGVVQPDQSQPQPGQPNAGPKTPEQILEMLRRGQQPPPNTLPNARPPQEN